MQVDAELISSENFNIKFKNYLRDFYIYQFKERGSDFKIRGTKDVYKRQGLKPTAIIIDDNWQKQYGTAMPDLDKWPTLCEFAEQEHQKGRKVVLWFKCWSAEGLDADECLSVWSQPVAADPTSPKYQERLKRTIYKLLSSEDGCYNCDGFKIDFANCLPVGVPVQAHEPGVYGVETVSYTHLDVYKRQAEPSFIPPRPKMEATIISAARAHAIFLFCRCFMTNLHSWQTFALCHCF